MTVVYLLLVCSSAVLGSVPDPVVITNIWIPATNDRNSFDAKFRIDVTEKLANGWNVYIEMNEPIYGFQIYNADVVNQDVQTPSKIWLVKNKNWNKVVEAGGKIEQTLQASTSLSNSSPTGIAYLEGTYNSSTATTAPGSSSTTTGKSSSQTTPKPTTTTEPSSSQTTPKPTTTTEPSSTQTTPKGTTVTEPNSSQTTPKPTTFTAMNGATSTTRTSTTTRKMATTPRTSSVTTSACTSSGCQTTTVRYTVTTSGQCQCKCPAN